MANLGPLWADQSFLRGVQYATDRNLAARQSIYAFQRPRLDLPDAVIGSLALTGTETIADVGCGNGAYLAELDRRGHRGRIVGFDASPGMLAAARRRNGTSRLVTADATALPLPDGNAGISLAMHMLYHVPDPAAAVRELRRVTAAAGHVVIGLNGDDHLSQLREIVHEVLAERGYTADHLVAERVGLSDGQEIAARYFSSVQRHDFVSELELPSPQPVADYVASMLVASEFGDQDSFVADVRRRVRFDDHGLFRVTTHCGWLICA